MAEEPKRLYMGSWATVYDLGIEESNEAPVCGTTACLAGWVAVLYPEKKSQAALFERFMEPFDFTRREGGAAARHELFIHKAAAVGGLYPYSENRAFELLGLDFSETDVLFLTGSWPIPFHGNYASAEDGSMAQVEVLVGRLQHFIDTGLFPLI